jgi:hypothetical protein
MMAVVAGWAIAVAGAWLSGSPLPEFIRSIPWGDLPFAAVLVGLALIAVGATLAALASAVPGRETIATASGGAALVGVALALGGGLWAVSCAPPGRGATLTGCLACMCHAAALAILPGLVASLFLVWAYARRPVVDAGLAAAGTVALGSLVVHMSCRGAGALHMLMGHALAPVLLGFALAVPIGLLIRHWSQHA